MIQKKKVNFLYNTLDIGAFCNIKDKKIEYELIIFINEKFHPLLASNKQEWVSNSYKSRQLPNLLIYKRIKEEIKKK